MNSLFHGRPPPEGCKNRRVERQQRIDRLRGEDARRIAGGVVDERRWMRPGLVERLHAPP
jgi:hypothetical protein